MIKLTLPKETAVQGGLFFEQVTEAANRGCKLEWNQDYTFAVQFLDTDIFFNEDYARSIVECGGDVEGYLVNLTIEKDKFENDTIPNFLIEYLNIQVSEESPAPKYKDVFNFAKPIYDIDTDGNQLDTYSSYSVINSVNSELLPMSITLQI